MLCSDAKALLMDNEHSVKQDLFLMFPHELDFGTVSQEPYWTLRRTMVQQETTSSQSFKVRAVPLQPGRHL